MAQRYPEMVRIVQSRVHVGDPQMTIDNKDVLSIRAALYDALVRWDGPALFRPALAERWTCSDDAQVWAFQLREGVRFHSGRVLRAADVVSSLRRLSDPSVSGEMATQGVIQSYLEGATFEAAGDSVVQVTTAEPMADLLDLLADVPMLDTDSAAASIPGTGPYKVVQASDEQLVMECFSDYWGGMARVKHLHWRAEPNASRRVAALHDGSVDLAAAIPPSFHAQIEAAGRVTLLEADTSLCVAFLFNCYAGACADRRIRQALNYGLDVQRVIDTVMEGAAQRTNGVFTPLHVGHDPDTAPFPYDPAKARDLLRDAGHAGGMNLIVDVPTQLPDESVALGRSLQEQYAALGISVTLREFADRPAYAHMVRDKQIDDACCFDSSPLSSYRILREKLHSGVRGPWWQGYRNATVDSLIDQAAATAESAARQRLYRQAYRLIHDDAPWVFLYSPRVYFGVGPALAGWQPGFNGITRFE